MTHSGRNVCANCGAIAESHFCANCGQRQHLPALTLRNLLREFLHQVLEWESRFVHTSWAFTAHPVQSTSAYVAGRRKAFSNPFSYVLIAAAISWLLTSPFNAEAVEGLRAAAQSGGAIPWPMSPAQQQRYLDYFLRSQAFAGYWLPLLSFLFAVMTRLTLFFRRPRIAEIWVVSLFGTGIGMMLHAVASPLLYWLQVGATTRVPIVNLLLVLPILHVVRAFLRANWRDSLLLVLAAALAMTVAATFQNYVAILYAFWPEF